MNLALACIFLAASASNVFEPRLVGDETYTEATMLMADLEDGSYLQVHFVVSNVGMGDGAGACRALFVRPDRPAWTASEDAGDDWESTATPQPSLRIGPCSVTSGDTTVAVAELAGQTLMLELQATARAIRPPGAVEIQGGEFYRNEVLIPWAPATVSRSGSGAGRYTARGHGFADHFRSTALPAQVARRHLRFRITDPACPTLLYVRFPPGEAEPVGWSWTTGQAQPEALAGEPKVSVSGGDQAQSRSAAVRASGVSFDLLATTLLYRHAPVEEHGFLGRMVGRWVGNPVTKTYRARRRGCPAMGIMELTDIK